MTRTVKTATQIDLVYYDGRDDPSLGVYERRPMEPHFTEELVVNVYFDDASIGAPAPLRDKKLQLEVSGTPRALEELGRYLIALGRLESEDPNLHEHLEDVPTESAQSVALIVRRLRA